MIRMVPRGEKRCALILWKKYFPYAAQRKRGKQVAYRMLFYATPKIDKDDECKRIERDLKIMKD